MKRELYDLSTSTFNPSQTTGLLPGGAGVQVAGSTPNPGISAPSLESLQLDVYDETAPTLITPGVTVGTPAPAGKLLVLDPITGAFGAKWKLSSIAGQALPEETYGVVTEAGQTDPNSLAQGSSAGNIAVPGSRARVVVKGPVKAYVQGTVGGSAISAGALLKADGAGNLTYAGASPAAGTVLATFADAPIASTVSIPVLANVYVGGF